MYHVIHVYINADEISDSISNGAVFFLFGPKLQKKDKNHKKKKNRHCDI